MNIKIIDSWLREYLDTKATSHDIAKNLSLTSVSVDRVEKIDKDYIYDIEVTTNRVDLMSVMGIAKEASTILPEHGIPASYNPPKIPKVDDANISFPIEIKNNPKLVNRIMAVVLEVKIDKSHNLIKNRLEKSDIRSLNNVIDVTNYVMREIGHPSHVFDFDLLNTKKIIIRESKKGEILTTLDNKKYSLFGGDIVADDGTGQIVDLLGVMGTKNSVVQVETKRILFFLDNNNSEKIRQTSMSLGIRSEAAIINEKNVDSRLLEIAFKKGIELFKENANGKIVSKTLDIYPNKPKPHSIKIANNKINDVIGIKINPNKSKDILEKLGFKVNKINNSLQVTPPSMRHDVVIEEDVIEEIARVYGYHKLPSTIPTFLNNKNSKFGDKYYFEQKTKNSLKYWGYSELYTYSLISEELFDGPIQTAVKLKNPLSEGMTYLRNSLVPSLLEVIYNNKNKDEIKIFELSNVYHKKLNNLPNEILMLAGIIKKDDVSFFEIKGLIEQLFRELGILKYSFKNRSKSPGANVFIDKTNIGYIELLDEKIIDFELNFDEILNYANNKKEYKQLTKHPAILEDITFVLNENFSTEEIISEIQLQSFLIRNVTLLDQYENSRTFHVEYRAEDKNLTNKEVEQIRKKIIKSIIDKFDAKVK